MLKKLMQPVMAVVLATGLIASSAPTAEAGHGRGIGVGIAAGIIGLGILGAVANRDRYYSRYAGECYPGPEECGFVNRRCFYNRWGDYVCRGGRWTCWRPTYCD